MSKRIAAIRNIGIIAHIDAGKTTTSERFLFYSGASHRIGSVDDGSTILDYLEQERRRGITITSAAATVPWQGYQINLVDTPGHVDFTVEVERSLRAIDGAITVLCGVGGVEPQTENVWSTAERYHLPNVVFVNKMDRLGADFEHAVQMVRDRLGQDTLIVQLPVGAGSDFSGIIDLLTMDYLVWDQPSQGASFTRKPIPAQEQERAHIARALLLEEMADRDDEFLEILLESDNPSEDITRRAIKRITNARLAVPVLCGAALRNIGVQPLLDAVVDFLPSPQERRPVQAMLKEDETLVELAPEEKDPFCALAFKVMYQESQSRLTYLRVYSGTLLPGEDLHNPTRDVTERPKRFYRLYADKRLKIDRIAAGDVVAVAGLGKAVTGDTLCSPARKVILAESMEFPMPVVSVAVEPRTRKDEERLTRAMEKLGVEDPTFSVREDKETGQTLISGMGELHLEVIVRRLEENFQVDARVGKPQVAYKETVTIVATAESIFERQLAGKLHWARVALSVAPADQGRGIAYLEAPELELVPSELREAAEQTVRATATAGVLMGYPMVDVKAQLLRVEYNAENPSPMAVAGAASKAFLNACSDASPVLLEPQVRLEISLPAENLGGVVDSLNARGGRVLEMVPRSAGHVVSAVAPMSTMFGYATELRSLTQGRGTLFMKFSHFAKRVS